MFLSLLTSSRTLFLFGNLPLTIIAALNLILLVVL
jgi:hypothetical protein